MKEMKKSLILIVIGILFGFISFNLEDNKIVEVVSSLFMFCFILIGVFSFPEEEKTNVNRDAKNGK